MTNINSCYEEAIVAADREYFLSELLPYDPKVKSGARLINGLKEYLFLLVTLEMALEAFDHRELSAFDPLVGENACQIRAIKIAMLDKELRHTVRDRILKKNLGKSRAIIQETLKETVYFSATQESLKDYLTRLGLDFSLNSNEVFLLISYILGKTKVLKPFNIQKPLVENATTDAKTMIHKIKGKKFTNKYCFLISKICKRFCRTTI